MKHVIIIGLGPQGLFLLREMSRLGINVYTISRKDEIGYYSKYGKKFLINNKNELIELLNRLANKFEEKIDCYIASGSYLSYLINNYPKLWDLFDVYPRPLESVKILNNKITTFKLASTLNIRILRTYTIEEIENKKLFNKLDYPIIAKWDINLNLFKKTKFKTMVLNNSEDLFRFTKQLCAIEKSNLVIQKYLGGNLKNNNISFGGYFFNGKAILGVLVNEIRHYTSGISSYVKEYDGDFSSVIKQQALKLINFLEFTGFVDVEFKICNEIPYLIDVNPRPFGFIKILKQKYQDIGEIFINSELNYELNFVLSNCEWVNILRDLLAIFSYCFSHKSVRPFFEVVSTYRTKKIMDVFDPNDLKPFIYQIIKRINF